MNDFAISNAIIAAGITIGTNGVILVGTNQWNPDYGHQVIALNKLVCEQADTIRHIGYSQAILVITVLIVGLINWLTRKGRP